MRNVLILILMFFCWGNKIAELSVKSFRFLENDLDARVNYPMKDQNGDSCAIIKVKTNQKGFSFEGDMTGIVKTIEKPSEIWLYAGFMNYWMLKL
jgi:hypothetical protein